MNSSAHQTREAVEVRPAMAGISEVIETIEVVPVLSASWEERWIDWRLTSEVRPGSRLRICFNQNGKSFPGVRAP